MSARRVLLVGMMGAGKTTVGRLLASRLDWRYLDSDEEVERATGHTVKELFDAGGERTFRIAESEALRDALSGPFDAVVSVAGGAVLDEENRALLRRAGTVVWLRARPKTLVRRLTADADGHRPLLDHDLAKVVEDLDRARRPLYEQVADVVVDVDDLDPDRVVSELQGALAR